MRTAFLFPGQGAQSPGYLHQLPPHESVGRTFDEASRLLGLDWNRLDSEAALESTVSVQLGTLIAGVAYARLLAAEQALPDAVAGLSVGAFTAAVASGALEFRDALELVRLRGTAMEETFGRHGFGMLAVLGLAEPEARALVEPIAGGTTPLYLASVNAPAEMVLAGSEAALEAALQAVQRVGARARRLQVNVPSHGPLLDGVSAQLRTAIRAMRLGRPRVPYVGNCRARALTRAEDIAEDLVLNVSHTVRWHESVTLLYELGCRLFVEMPPGRALSGLARQEFSEARAVAAVDIDAESVVHLVRRASFDGV
jgi:malonate decarboxylase epsilon subunit